MALLTRQNPDTDALEVFVDTAWVPFDTYRSQQIEDAYQASVVFLRERLGDDQARKLEQTTAQLLDPNDHSK